MAILVNVGCGNRTHPAWVNLDLVARSSEVVEHDLRRGLPFDAETCDAVYHSHVLEHLTRPDARRLLSECFRVLKPGGVIRVVVPDLERIAELYLAALREADSDPQALVKVNWMKLELFDQVARVRSGGDMLPFVRGEGAACESFIRSRLGEELFGSRPNAKKRRDLRAQLRRIRKALQKARRAVSLAVVTLLEGSAGRTAFQEAIFRQSGELHRWMYDRVSLKAELEALGFSDVVVCSAEQSRIRDFAIFELDSTGGQVRKPDSLFIEAVKPPSCLAVHREAA